MADTLRLEIITPQATVYSEDVNMVTLPVLEGQIGVYPQHVRVITQIVPGELIVSKDGDDGFLAVGEGLVEITGNRVAIVTDMAIPAERIDEAKVQEARERAAARLQEKISDEEVATVNASLAHWHNWPSSSGGGGRKDRCTLCTLCTLPRPSRSRPPQPS